MEKIVLPSTQEGFVSQYFWSLLWSLLFLWAALWCLGYIESIYTILDIDSWDRFRGLSRSKKNDYWMIYPFPFLYIGMYISYIIAGIIALANLYAFVYSAKEITTFLKSDDDYWDKVFAEAHGFPFSKTTIQTMFDRIVDIEIEQSSIDRILNTGTLRITMIIFTNADSREQEWIIPAIKRPYERKAELETALLGHEGLVVKLLQKREKQEPQNPQG